MVREVGRLDSGRHLGTDFMLDFFRMPGSEGRLVFVCLHPNEP